jgi:hypothetical protein
MKTINFRKVIKDLHKAGYSNALIAHETGYSPAYIGQLEKGHRRSPCYDLGAQLIAMQLAADDVKVEWTKKDAG